ncbi:MAG: hypothetical protein KGJ72_11305 [Gammaproteobacteria bacterium]|nr:hypothetical protein [Gammaproteobacteria bacterium]
MNHRGLTCCFVGWVIATMAGCATTTGTAGLECGLGGAGASYLACKLAHGSDARCAEVGALVGAGGALACSLYARHLEERRKELAGKENDLDAQIRYVQGLNADTRQLNTDLAQRVASVTQSTDKVVAEIQQQQISQAQLAQERKTRSDLLRTSQEEVNQGTQALQTAKDLRAKDGDSAPALDAAIRQQEQLLAEAQRQVALLAAQRDRV